MIFPALPCNNINLVEETLSESRNRVMKRSIEGNVDNSRASFENRVIIKTATASDILLARSKSNNGVGMRINRVARIITMPTAKIMLLLELEVTLSTLGLDKLVLSEAGITIYSPK